MNCGHSWVASDRVTNQEDIDSKIVPRLAVRCHAIDHVIVFVYDEAVLGSLIRNGCLLSPKSKECNQWNFIVALILKAAFFTLMAHSIWGII